MQGSTIADVEVTGHLCTVLSCLDSLQDLIRCSAVSKSWKEACEKVQPEALDMPINQWAPEGTVAQMGGILQYLQLQDRKGRFCKLRCLQVSWYCETSFTRKLDFMRSLLTLAGSWELHRCHIDGCFTLSTAAALLPSCLQHIALSSAAWEPMDCYVLDNMQRFPDLCTLQLGSDVEFSGCSESLYLAASLPNLSTLHLHGNLLFRPTNGNITYPARFGTLPRLLPKMRHLACCIFDFYLQEVLSMPHVVCGNLRVECPEADGLRITIGATSKLRHLVIEASPVQELQLLVFQPLLSYFVHSRGIQIKHNFEELTSSVYAPPLLFNMHHDLS